MKSSQIFMLGLIPPTSMDSFPTDTSIPRPAESSTALNHGDTECLSVLICKSQYREKHLFAYCEQLGGMATKPRGVFLDTETENAFHTGEAAMATAAAVGVSPPFLTAVVFLLVGAGSKHPTIKSSGRRENKALSFHINYCYCMDLRDKCRTELGCKIETANATSYI